MQIATTDQSMTSREIADLTGKQHKHVLRDIRELVSKLYEIDGPDLDHAALQGVFVEKDARGYVSSINLDKDHTLTLLTGYDAKARLRVVKRWQELEAEQAKPALPDFSDPVAAARAWADAKESEQKALVQLEAAKPAVEYHARVAVADDCHSLDEAAKILKTGPRKLRQWMRDNKLLRLDGLPSQEPMNRGYFRVIEKTIELPFGHKLHKQVLVTGKGMIYLQRKLDHELMGQTV